jgi:hypothetical protein
MERKNGSSEREPVRPVHVIKRDGLKAAIWRNVVDNGQNSGPMYNTTVSRSYKERDSDEWKDTNGFGYDDLLGLSKIVNEAHSWIAEQRSRDREELRQQSGRSTNNRRERQAA